MKMKYFSVITLLILSGCSLNAVDEKATSSEFVEEQQAELAFAPVKTLDEKIGSMLMVGFMGTSAPRNSQICRDIQKYDLAGVILFDMNPVNHKKAKNIANKSQVAKLTQQLQ